VTASLDPYHDYIIHHRWFGGAWNVGGACLLSCKRRASAKDKEIDVVPSLCRSWVGSTEEEPTDHEQTEAED
jgi:hypothetical protein